MLLVGASHRNLRERVSPRPREGMATWALAWREFKKRPGGLGGLTLLALIYTVAFLCPVLAAYGPDDAPLSDSIVVKNLPPGGRVFALGDTKRGLRWCRGWTLEGDHLLLDRGPDATSARLRFIRGQKSGSGHRVKMNVMASARPLKSLRRNATPC